MQSHCQLPTVLALDDNLYRIYFASRDKRQYSHIGYVDIDIRNPFKPLSFTKEPILYPGEIGHFDEHGVFPSAVIRKGQEVYLYYIGWNKGYEPPLFYASIGVAISDDGGTVFRKYSNAPVLSRNEYDPCLVTSPCVYLLKSSRLGMIYTSGVKWERDIHGKLKSYYHLKFAESTDGIKWRRDGLVAIDFQGEDETNIARGWVIQEDGLYKMWYCFVKGKQLYRIGYAESKDGIKFQRKDSQAGIDVSPNEFDSEMICYPNVFFYNKRKYMVYNGNNYGEKGIGLAIFTGN